MTVRNRLRLMLLRFAALLGKPSIPATNGFVVRVGDGVTLKELVLRNGGIDTTFSIEVPVELTRQPTSSRSAPPATTTNTGIGCGLKGTRILR